MRFTRNLLVAGAASIALAGAAIAANEARTHVLSIALPDGSIEQVHYSGDVPPKVVIVPAASIAPMAFFDTAFGPESPFAMMDRISEQMDRQADAMLHQAATMAAQSSNGTTFTNMPAGPFHYTMVSSSSGDGKGCTRSVQITSTGEGQQPRVINASSGDCSAVAAPGVTPAVAPDATAVPGAADVRPVAYQPVKQPTAARHPII
ncbi:MAG: hypothetical protein JWR77_1130 [Rhizorhabdus sp.]|nr:hypothetical protein [Rhizorhabdus sp.]